MSTQPETATSANENLSLQKPRVSILIGTRERGRAVKRCIESILRQKGEEYEILVLDDGSTQMNVVEFLKGEFQDPRLKLHRSEKSLGVGGGRSFLMKRAQGEFIIVIDDDAYFSTDDALTTLTRLMNENPKVGILSFKIVDHQDWGTRLLIPFSVSARKKNPEIEVKQTKASYFLGGGHAIRRNLIEKIGAYHESLFFGEEELDLSYRAIDAGFEIAYTPEIEVLHFPEASVVAKNERAHSELYYHMRNRLFIAHRYLPQPYKPVYVALWSGQYLIRALRTSQVRDLTLGFIDGWRYLRQVEKKPLSASAIRYLKANYGRLWY